MRYPRLDLPWLREPLVQFFLAGALLFAAWTLVRPHVRASAVTDRIEIGAGEIDQLARQFERQWRRPPSTAELQGLVADRVREEVLYREALAMGLDRDDVVIRRRLAQKFQFLTEDLAAAHTASDAELAAYLAAHAERYRPPARVSLRHLYFSDSRRGERARADAARALSLVRAGGMPDGDPFLLEATFTDMTYEQVGRVLGAEFADTLARLTGGAWEGPVRSSYGWHLVHIDHRVEPAQPPLASVRDQVRRDWDEAQRRDMNEQLYRRLLARYQVVIQPRAAGEAEAAVLASPDGARR